MQPRMITQAVILAGGVGSRLGSLSALCPKPALPVGRRPFLAYVFGYLREQGIREVIVSSGHLAQKLQDLTRPWAGDLDVRYVCEEQALGTGGALRHCLPWLNETFFVCNGDSLFNTSLQPLAEALAPPFDAVLALRKVPDTSRFGCVHLSHGVVSTFQEKKGHGSGLINAGVYAMRRSAVEKLSENPSSLENDFFPVAATQGRLAGVQCEGLFLDIGIPSAYAASHHLLNHSNSSPLRKAVFLDRDGTLIVEKNYLHDPEEVELLPRVVEGLRLLQESGYALVMVTNQSGIGRGYFSEENMHAVNARVAQLLATEGVTLDGVYHCPHVPNTPCLCRKPLPGMLAKAAVDLSLDLSQTITIGDKPCDVDLGRLVGGQGILVRTGYGEKYATQGYTAHYIADDLFTVAEYIVENMR